MEKVLALVEKMNMEWVAFKADNDRAMKEAKENGGKVDVITAEKIDKHSKAIGELQAQITEVEKKQNRPGTGGADEKVVKSAAHRKAFNQYMRRGDATAESELRSIQASLSVASDPDGGYTVPAEMDKEIEKYERDASTMRQLCRVITVSSERYEKMVKQGSASSGWVGEIESRSTTGTPQWALLAPFFGELYAKPKVTQKILDDSELDLEKELAEDVGVEFAEQENAAYTIGTGIKKPKGILGYTLNTTADGSRAVDAIEKKHTGSSGTFGTTADKLIDLVHLLKPGYRAGAVFMMSTLSVGEIRKIKDGASNYIFQPSLLAGQPPAILGYPIVENEDVPDPAADSNSVIFGNLRRAYQIVDVVGTRMLRDPYTDKPFCVYYTTKRTGGFLVNNRAVKVLTLST